MLVAQGERLARVLLGLDAADLVLARLVVEQQDDQARDRGESVEVGRAGELVAGAGGEQAALAGAQHDARFVGTGPVADAGRQLARCAPASRRACGSTRAEMSRRLLGASSSCSSGTRSSVPGRLADELDGAESASRIVHGDAPRRSGHGGAAAGASSLVAATPARLADRGAVAADGSPAARRAVVAAGWPNGAALTSTASRRHWSTAGGAADGGRARTRSAAAWRPRDDAARRDARPGSRLAGAASDAIHDPHGPSGVAGRLHAAAARRRAAVRCGSRSRAGRRRRVPSPSCDSQSGARRRGRSRSRSCARPEGGRRVGSACVEQLDEGRDEVHERCPFRCSLRARWRRTRPLARRRQRRRRRSWLTRQSPAPVAWSPRRRPPTSRPGGAEPPRSARRRCAGRSGRGRRRGR